jgi:uncharacterized membrane protein
MESNLDLFDERRDKFEDFIKTDINLIISGNIDAIDEVDYVKRIRLSLSKIASIKTIIDGGIQVILYYHVPIILIENADKFMNLLQKQINSFNSLITRYDRTSYKKFESGFESIYNDLFANEATPNEIIESHPLPFLNTFNAIKLYESQTKETINNLFLEMKDDYVYEMQEAHKKANNNLTAIEKKMTKMDSIVSETEKKAGGFINSEFSKTFHEEHKGHRRYSDMWLIAGIVSILAFFSLILLTNVFKNLPTEGVYGDHVKYYVSNIILKLTMISITIFFISFCFKQYSVNRHLSTINKHRANAFGSYKLFEALAKDGPEKNVLLHQLAKAIYEQTSTGFINDKGGINPSVLEITKMFGENAAKN